MDPEVDQAESEPTRLSVLVIGEQEIMVAGVRHAVEGDGIRTTHVSTDHAEEQIPADQGGHDVCLLVAIPDDTVVSLITQVRARAPEMPVIVASSDGTHDGEVLLAAVRGGADGWLSLEVSSSTLCRTIRAVHAGEPGISRRHVARLLSALRRPAGQEIRLSDGRVVELTPREHEMLALLSAQCSTKDIAARFRLSAATVRWHIARLMKKLEVENRADVVALATRGQRSRTHPPARTAPDMTPALGA